MQLLKKVIWRSQTFDLKFLVLGSLSLVHSLASSAHISFGFTLRWLLFAKWLVEYNAALASICFMILLGFVNDVLDVPWRVLVVGGGDGGVLREISRHNTVI